MTRRPRLCAKCGKLAGTAEICPHCGARQTALRKVMGGLAGADEGLTVTGAVLTVNIALFAAALLLGRGSESGAMDFFRPDMELLFRVGLQDNAAIAAGQWWRLVTMMFLHLGLLHVVFNCWILWQAGRLFEQDLGHAAMAVVYLGAGLAGSIASFFAQIGGAGASGAVFGVLGALLVRRRMVDGNFKHPVTQWMLSLFAINIVFGLAMSQTINQVAHGAGFIVGAALGYLVSRTVGSRAARRVVKVSAAALGAFAVAAFVFMVLSLYTGSAHDVMAADRCWHEVALIGASADDENVDAARRCLSELPRLEAPANAARERGLAALTALEAASDAGSARDALSELEDAALAYRIWQDRALPRYRLTYR
ncbi:MAG: rhomboid family intramembrane serine protease [Deltaproteobacteria bacterium]|nr:rhomboid family intramembrane serine protease [Deltaproteobacteria bacterium]MCB9788708.1 rhomboid family intramembrane serine protease [Deltaproteobacteria bacterium]